MCVCQLSLFTKYFCLKLHLLINCFKFYLSLVMFIVINVVTLSMFHIALIHINYNIKIVLVCWARETKLPTYSCFIVHVLLLLH